MKTIDLSINDFSDLSYALIKQEEVVADQQFDGHMYSDTENKITMGVGFNIEERAILQVVCAKKMNLLVSSSTTANYLLSDILIDPQDINVINEISTSISLVIQEFHSNNKIHKNDKQDLSRVTTSITQEYIDYINDTVQQTSSSKSNKHKTQQTTKQDITHDNSKHLRALRLEQAVNKKIINTIKHINDSKICSKQYEVFELILTLEESKEIFIYLSRNFHNQLISSLLSGRKGFTVFKSNCFNKYSKLIVSFLCGHYQMPAKFSKYNDPTDYFYHAININNSRFLSWFGIRYYIDLVSASVKDQYNSYIKRRLHEAAVFELVERKEDGTIDIYQTSKDIFTHLNIIFKFIKSDTNPPLTGYNNKTFLEFIREHKYSQSIDMVATNKKNNISFSTLEEYSVIFDHVSKIEEIKSCLPEGVNIDENKYVQSILDFATYEDVFQPFLLYMNEKFSKDILNIDFKLDEIYVVYNTNLNEFTNSVKKYFNDEITEDKKILLISQSTSRIQQRFDRLLEADKQHKIILYLLKNQEHILVMDNISNNNFMILLYDDNETINAISLSGTYILQNEDNEEKLLYCHETNNEIEAEYLFNENIFIIIYHNTKVYLRNFFPSKFHAGIILSNQSDIQEDTTAVSQVGDTSITVKFEVDETIQIDDLDKKKYYLCNTRTREVIDSIIEVSGSNVSCCFKINISPEDISNTKFIFSFDSEVFLDIKTANTNSYDTAILDKATMDSKSTTIKFKINRGDILGIVTGVSLLEPSRDNLPDVNSFMATAYKLKATTKGVVNPNYIKWCYAVLTNQDYYSRMPVKDRRQVLSFTGEEISFKPSDILSEGDKEKLLYNQSKLCVFAYMKSPAYKTTNGETHVVCEIKNKTTNIQVSNGNWHDPLDKMEICLFSEGGHYKPWHNTFGLKVRDNENKHQGIDLYARVGTPVYACMDGEIISIKSQHDVGTVVLKVTGKQVEILRNMEKKDYQNIFYNEVKTENYQEEHLNFKYDSDVFVFRYMHLDEVYITDTNKYVKCGQIIGRSGIKSPDGGIYKNSHNPHLHFEIASSEAMKQGNTGLNYRINPRVYIDYKLPDIDLSSEGIDVSICKRYFQSGGGNNLYLNNAYEEFREQVECMLNPAPYRVNPK